MRIVSYKEPLSVSVTKYYTSICHCEGVPLIEEAVIACCNV